MARTADILGDKWTLLILRDAFFGTSTFSQFQKNLGVARNILTDRLEKLVEFGVLHKKPIRPGVERYEYTLTESGLDLTPVLIAMTQWGDRWIFGEGKEPFLFFDKNSDTPIQTVQVQSREGRTLQAEDITARPAPENHRKVQ